jgi:fructosamine-3-kinase
MEGFRKSAWGPDPAFAFEAAGLRWLRVPGGARVVEVLDVGESFIVTEEVRSGWTSREAAQALGEGLVVTHDAGAAGFGAAPGDYAGPCFIGRLPMAMPPAEAVPGLRWGEFYAEYRVLDPARRALADGSLSAADMALFEKLAEKLRDGAFDDPAPAARIHGDLWSGNVLWGEDAAVLIDPAAHGGHRITDLAMFALFHAPHLEQVFDAYAAASTWLPDGWRELIPLHQVNPLLVHTALFGSGFRGGAVSAARRYV